MYFPTTKWSLLAEASLNGESNARQALEELFRRYWAPLHQFIRSRGYTQTEAQDLTQEFLLHLLEHSTLKKADRTRGKFRSFLLGALVRFLGDERDRRQAKKRGSGAVHLSLDAEVPDLPGTAGPDATLFDREWGLVILETALRVLQQEQNSSHSAQRFEVLRRFLPGSVDVPPYESAAGELGISVPALKSELHRLRLKFKMLVRQEVAATVSAPHEIDEEMDHLQNVLANRGNDIRTQQKPPTWPS